MAQSALRTNPALRTYFEAALEQAHAEAIPESKYCAAQIPGCVGLAGYGESLEEALEDLRSALEDWVVLGLRLGDTLPTFGEVSCPGYFDLAMATARFEQAGEHVVGRIPGWVGLLSFGTSREEADDNLRATLAEWIAEGYQDGVVLPAL